VTWETALLGVDVMVVTNMTVIDRCPCATVRKIRGPEFVADPTCPEGVRVRAVAGPRLRRQWGRAGSCE
jgi:hypothetical protein